MSRRVIVLGRMMGSHPALRQCVIARPVPASLDVTFDNFKPFGDKLPAKGVYMWDVLRNLFWVGLLPFTAWLSGMNDKYPELTLPFFIMWLVIVSPLLRSENDPTVYHFRRYRKSAEKYGDYDLVEKIDEHLQYVSDWQTPATVGAVKSALGKYDGYRGLWLFEVEKRLRELRATKAKSD